MRPLAEIGNRLDAAINGTGPSLAPDEAVALGEEVLEYWVTAKGLKPTQDQREGFRMLALHRQGAQGDPSFNACRETCRELIYHFNLLTMQSETIDVEQVQKMMALIANHLFLFVSGKMETQQLGDFCCSSKPLHAVHKGV